MQRVLVINGPNLNLLGTRQPEIYGSTTLTELESTLTSWGQARGIDVSCYQSNHEGAIIDRLHDARHSHDGLIINAGALTHYSYAIHDAIVASNLPAVEVHISNVKTREPWRRQSVLEPACLHTIYGRGIDGYRFALDHLVHRAATDVEQVNYGPADDQFGDLRLPAGPGPHPVAVLLHGGFWRDHWTRDLMDGPAVDLTGRGWATWNLEYHRMGSGGGWPLTLEDVAAGIDHLAAIAADHPLDLGRVVVIGHSAGGQLALWSAARPHLAEGTPDTATQVPLRGVVALAPVSDLITGHEEGLGDGAVEEFLRRRPTKGDGRYRASSPAQLLPLGVPQVVIHGTRDDAVPVTMSRTYVEAARNAGDSVEYHELEDVDHMGLIDPQGAPWAMTVIELERFI
jgi:3-dehydroquinate dehydratase type II